MRRRDFIGCAAALVALLAASAAADEPRATGFVAPSFVPNVRRIESNAPTRALLRGANDSLPSRWDSREHGCLTPVKNQGQVGSCWSFASYAVLETQMLKAGRGEYEFSVKNMVNLHGFKNKPDEGGDYNMSEAYLLRWNGPVAETNDRAAERSFADEEVAELACNVDDMTGEAIGFAIERLLDAGALDVWTEAIGMKKSRPGTCITVLCHPDDKEAIIECLFRNTTTIGVREQTMRRHVLARQSEKVRTSLGTIRRKTATGYGVTRCKWESEDVAAAAREHGKSLAEIEAILDSETKP